MRFMYIITFLEDGMMLKVEKETVLLISKMIYISVLLDQIYLYKKDNKIKCHLNYCFVTPVQDNQLLEQSKEKKLLGIVKYCNDSLELKEVNVGDLVSFSPDSEFEFIVEEERLYCMKSNEYSRNP